MKNKIIIAILTIFVFIAFFVVYFNLSKFIIPTNYLYRISVNGKYGYIDKNGEIIIKPQYDEAKDFSEGLGAVEKENKWGYIDDAGKVVIPLKFNKSDFDEYEGRPFSEGLAAVKIDGKYGFINKSGKLIIQPKFDYVSDFSEGLATFTNYIGDNLAGFIDKKGNIAIKPQYGYAHNFKNGLAHVCINPHKIKDGYKILDDAFINKKGSVVFNLTKLGYSSNRPEGIVYPFSEGLLSVYNDKNLYGYIDTKGIFVIQPKKYDNAENFANGYAVINIKGHEGYIDKTGKITINPQFFIAKDFSEGLAAVMKDYNGKYGYIDKTGKFVIKPIFDDAQNFKNGLALVYINNKQGYINQTGKFIWKEPEEIQKKEKSTLSDENKANDNSDNIDFEQYMKNVQDKIKSNWQPTKSETSKTITVMFKVGKDGSVLSSIVKESSGDEELDNTALKAVNTSRPFEPLPSNFEGNDVDIEFTFDYNVFGNSYSTKEKINEN